ncbi:MAG: hypothetical protein ABI949_00745 [Ilumatobacteraceae bacterium]
MSRARAIAFGALSGAVAVVLTANVVFADDRGMGGGFGRHRRGGDTFFFFPVLMLITVGVLLVVLWRGRHPVAPLAVAATTGASPTFNAQAILADRLARGEISPDDYRSAITVLREPPAAPLG